MNIRHDIPVTLFDYRAGENPLYSLAKLKIFYIGMTPDKRLFTQEFSENLLKTLPYVPVVGYYNQEDEDFEGHSQTQYIYGIVPENTDIEFVEEDDKEYAICDVILYTGRKDETGEIAEKIVGKPHSLELNPDDTTYEIKKDDEGNLEYVEFKTGSLLGLSVLGDNEQPAFTGSEFFKHQEKFKDIIQGFKTEWEKYNDADKNKRGNEEMEFDLFKAVHAFMEVTYDEKVAGIVQKLSEDYDYFYVPQVFNDYFIVAAVTNEETWEIEHYRISYSSEDGTIEFGDKINVFPRYLTAEEVEKWETSFSEESFEDTGDEESDETDEFNETEETEVETETDNEEEFNSEEEVEEETEVEETDGDFEEQEENNNEAVEDNEEDFSNETEEEEEESEEFSSTSLTDSERKELEAFRKEKKLALIKSFEEDLKDNFLEELSKQVDEFSLEELDTILAKEFTKARKEEKIKNATKINPLMYRGNRNSETASDVKALIDEYKDKE